LPDDELLLKVEQRLSCMLTESSRHQVSAA
jgi:hypothetical protein